MARFLSGLFCIKGLDMKEIRLLTGEVTIIDDCDFDCVSAHRWFRIVNRSKSTYAAAFINGETVLLHRFLLNPGKTVTVDHANHNTLDNRRCNLRLATAAQQSANTRVQKNNKCGFKGVCWDESRKKWRALLCHRTIGRFDRIEDAAAAYNQAAKEAYGEFAYLNDI